MTLMESVEIIKSDTLNFAFTGLGAREKVICNWATSLEIEVSYIL